MAEYQAKPVLLIFELRMMGDAMMSLPFIRAAQLHYRVVVCCQPSVVDVFKLLLPLNQIIAWLPPWLDTADKSVARKWKDSKPWGLIKRLRKLKADTVVSVWADPRMHLLMALSGAKIRVGFPVSRQNFYAVQAPWRRRQVRQGILFCSLCEAVLWKRLLTDKVTRADYFQHHVEDWRQLAVALRLSWDTRTPWFEVPQVDVAPDVVQFIAETRKRERRLWLVHPGARTANRRWSLNHFKQLIDKVLVPNDVSVLLINPLEAPVAPCAGRDVLTYRPKDFADFLQVLAMSEAVICNDTGVAHAAAALGKRTISVFSANLPQWFGPFGNLDLVAEQNVCPHRPCLDRCVMPSFVCLEGVTVDAVARQARKLF